MQEVSPFKDGAVNRLLLYSQTRERSWLRSGSGGVQDHQYLISLQMAGIAPNLSRWMIRLRRTTPMKRSRVFIGER
jgi:hypothetical protein